MYIYEKKLSTDKSSGGRKIITSNKKIYIYLFIESQIRFLYQITLRTS